MLKTFVRNCISKLPPGARRNVELAVLSMMNTVHSWSLDSEFVKGRISGQTLQGSVIYFGEPTQYRSWIAKFFVHSQTPVCLGQYRLLDIVRFRQGLSKYDLAICPVNPATEILFSHRGWRIIPKLIDWVMDLRRPLKEMLRSRNVKKRISRLRKYNYTFSVTKSESALEEFYYEMLIPSMKKRHKELAYISSLYDHKERLKNGFLLCAYREDQWVGAELVVSETSKTLRSANIGWRNGDDRLLRDDIHGALTFELINRMKNEGFEYLNLGNSLPFVDDGVFEFKSHWGFYPVMPGFDLESGKVLGVGGFLAVYFNLASKSGRAMLHQNPVLEKHGRILRTVAWDSQPRPRLRRLLESGIAWIDLSNT